MIIENILNETTDLTGRVNIYAKTAMIMNANPLYGVGIDNNYEVSMRLTHAADVQNGILDIILSYGWIGVIILFVLQCLLLYGLFSISSGKTKSKKW